MIKLVLALFMLVILVSCTPPQDSDTVSSVDGGEVYYQTDPYNEPYPYVTPYSAPPLAYPEPVYGVDQVDTTVVVPESRGTVYVDDNNVNTRSSSTNNIDRNVR